MSSFATDPPPKDLEVESGQAAIFEFPALLSEPTASVSWQAEDSGSLQLYGGKYATTVDNRLVVLSVEASDEKRYR